MINTIKCFFGEHETYSRVLDEDYDKDLSGMSDEEIIQEFHEQSKLRCKHCDYTYPK